MFPLISGSGMHTFIVYTLRAVQVLSSISGLGPKPNAKVPCASREPGNAAQHTLAWSLHACTRVMSYTIAPAYTKLASSAARTVLYCQLRYS